MAERSSLEKDLHILAVVRAGTFSKVWIAHLFGIWFACTLLPHLNLNRSVEFGIPSGVFFCESNLMPFQHLWIPFLVTCLCLSGQNIFGTLTLELVKEMGWPSVILNVIRKAFFPPKQAKCIWKPKMLVLDTVTAYEVPGVCEDPGL